MNAVEFAECLPLFRTFNQSKGLSMKTIQTYNAGLQQFLRWITEAYGNEVDVTAHRIREFAGIRLEKGNKRTTVRSYMDSLRAFYSFLVLDEIVPELENPMRRVQKIRITRPQIDPLSNKDTRRFLAAFNQHKLVDYRDYTICLLILDTGLRASEALGVRLGDINAEHNSIRVRGKGGKKRTVYMGKQMQKKLADYLQGCRPWIADGHTTLFPPASPTARRDTISVIQFSASVRKKMDQIGVRRNHSSSHRLRHTFATMYLRNGGDPFTLQRLLGHSSLEMTKRYVTLAQEDLQEAHAKASPVDRIELRGSARSEPSLTRSGESAASPHP